MGPAQAREIYDRLFFDIDLDDSKSLSLSEARGREPFQTLFRLMDRNSDGQIVPGEMNAALALFEGLWRGRALLGVKDRGMLMFGNLDASGDDRLGLRELGEASTRLASFDRNGDGQVTAAESRTGSSCPSRRHPLRWRSSSEATSRTRRPTRQDRCPPPVRTGFRRWTATTTGTFRSANSWGRTRRSSGSTSTVTG